jgi:hypothetical protein
VKNPALPPEYQTHQLMLDDALQLHQKGRLSEAGQLYQRILAINHTRKEILRTLPI